MNDKTTALSLSFSFVIPRVNSFVKHTCDLIFCTPKKNPLTKEHVHSIFVLEASQGGVARWVHAEAANLPSGYAVIAFADNQVISNNFSGGIDFYTVIPVKVISIP